MQIYHNPKTQELIIVKNDMAFSVYLYKGDIPFEVATAIINTTKDLTTCHTTCKLITLPTLEQTQDTPKDDFLTIQEKANKSLFKERKMKCVHSQKTKKLR